MIQRRWFTDLRQTLDGTVNIFFEAYCPYCHNTEECMVDHGNDDKARIIAIGKMVDHLREVHKVTMDDNSQKA